ncbi:hypothetical protein CBR_g3142 [Chara braunii]|uniref:Uncharacterized protein n=1 Tax=Chara braunii TaxID=69332 RepID=A0A388KEW5_CHABU|nr:hypothetical protein CBR_g3142 [Chara braunii]|eukprot:GBG68598.1 hypothetical protein CBR_g3142 [Chara braunii]
MEDGLHHLSTAELVEFVCNHKFKFRSASVEEILRKLVRRAVDLIQEKDPEADEDGGGDAEHYSEERMALAEELASLYNPQLYDLLMSVLSSPSTGTRVSAGATYFLALLTAGTSSNAEALRTRMTNKTGVVRLITLLSAASSSVRFNALLVLVNLLRHCPDVHAEVLRLGGLRKIAMMFGEAVEEPQQNICLTALLCLCESKLAAIPAELLRMGAVGKVLSWIGSRRTSKRVAHKALASLASLVDLDGATRKAMFEQQAVVPLLSLLRRAKTEELLVPALELLALFCGEKEIGNEPRTQCLQVAGYEIVMELAQRATESSILIQALRVLCVSTEVDDRVSVRVQSHPTFLRHLEELLVSEERTSPEETRDPMQVEEEGDSSHSCSIPSASDVGTMIRFLSACMSKWAGEKAEHAGPSIENGGTELAVDMSEGGRMMTEE